MGFTDKFIPVSGFLVYSMNNGLIKLVEDSKITFKMLYHYTNDVLIVNPLHVLQKHMITVPPSGWVVMYSVEMF